MRAVFLLYETDEWTSRISMNLLFIGSSVKMCQWYIKKQYKDKLDKDKLEGMLHELGQCRQTQCSNVGFEFYIDAYEVNKMPENPFNKTT